MEYDDQTVLIAVIGGCSLLYFCWLLSFFLSKSRMAYNYRYVKYMAVTLLLVFSLACVYYGVHAVPMILALFVRDPLGIIGLFGIAVTLCGATTLFAFGKASLEFINSRKSKPQI